MKPTRTRLRLDASVLATEPQLLAPDEQEARILGVLLPDVSAAAACAPRVGG